MNSDSFADKLDKRLMKAISLGGVAICLALAIITLPLKHFEYALFNLITASICLVSFIAYTKRLYNLTLWLFFIGVPLMMVLYIYKFGNISSHYYIIPGGILLTFLTKRKKYWNEIVWIVMAILFMGSEFILFHQGKFAPFNQLESILHFSNGLAAIALIYVVSFYFRNMHENYRSILERNNAVKEKLISVVSHDLRAPINSIRGILNLFDQNEISEAELKMLIKRLSVQVDKTSSLLDNTLLWIKNQLNSQDPNIESIKVVDFLELTINLYENQIQEKGIKIIYKCNIAKTLRIETDSEMLKLVIRNILSNAIKFTPEVNGTIEVECLNQEDGIQLLITDNGQGMTKEQIKGLYNLNHTLSSKGTSGEIGYGLGLHLVKNYADKLKIKIDVKSEPKLGSTFILQIPNLSNQP